MKNIFLLLISVLSAPMTFAFNQQMRSNLSRLDSLLEIVTESRANANYNAAEIVKAVNMMQNIDSMLTADADLKNKSISAFDKLCQSQQTLIDYLYTCIAEKDDELSALRQELKAAKEPWLVIEASNGNIFDLPLPAVETVTGWPEPHRARYYAIAAAQAFNRKIEVMRKWYRRALEDSEYDINKNADKLDEEEKAVVRKYFNNGNICTEAYNDCSDARDKYLNIVKPNNPLNIDEAAKVQAIIDELKLYNNLF